jgi:hypothetical protein
MGMVLGLEPPLATELELELARVRASGMGWETG